MSLELFDYFRDIEEAFCGRRGAPLLLSTLDFEKAVEWFNAGITIEVITRGIDAYFTKLEKRKVPPRKSICLSFAEPEILKELEARRVSSIGRSAGVQDEGDSLKLRFQYLKSLADQLNAFASNDENREKMPVTVRFAEETGKRLELLSTIESSPTDMEKELGPLDRELGKLVLLESPRKMTDTWRKDALKRLQGFSETMTKEALDQTVDGFIRKSAISYWSLPRLSLLYL